MSSDKENDSLACPLAMQKCIQRGHILALEEKVTELTRICEELVDRKGVFEELTVGIRSLNTWAPSVDAALDRMSLQSGMVASGVEQLRSDISGVRNDVTVLQEIVKNGNGKREG